MDNTNNHLYGSAGTTEGIIKVIESFWYRKDITLIPVEAGKKEVYQVKTGEKIADGWQVIRKGKRYRFELVNNV